MSSFNDFLRKHGVPESIQATDETVSFENTNGKKFVYPLLDVERCLKAIWQAGDSLDKLLGGDWTYEETKYRSALSQVLRSEQEWNAVVSSLGSQTPNTVRCLELYAYYRLNKEPTATLQKPEILRPETLAPIFKTRSLTQEFGEWLQKQGKRPKSVQNYTGALSGILSRCADRPLLEIFSASLLESLRKKVLGHTEVVSANTKGKQMYSTAFDHYSNFLKQRSFNPSSKIPEVRVDELLRRFDEELKSIGFW